MPAPPRNQVPDLMKGFAMLMVIVCHALQRTVGNTAGDYALWDWVYAWHMPLFFIVSGYLAGGSSRVGSPRYVRDKFFRLIYVWFVWRWLEWIFMRFPFSGLMPFNSYVPTDFLGNLKAFIDSPFRPLWFMPDLFLIFMLLCVCKWLSFKKEWIVNTLLAVLTILSVVLYVHLRKHGGEWAFWNYDVQFFGSFTAGYLFRRLRAVDERRGEGPWKSAFVYMAVFGALTSYVWMFVSSANLGILRTWGESALWTGLIALILWYLTQLPFTEWIRKPLAFMGQYSMEYYTLQFLCLDCGWFIANSKLQFAVNLLACLVICTVLIFVIKRYLRPLDYILWGGFPFSAKCSRSKKEGIAQ